jgi:hypothetical protein
MCCNDESSGLEVVILIAVTGVPAVTKAFSCSADTAKADPVILSLFQTDGTRLLAALPQ